MGIRLLIVDDHDVVREGLRLAFAGTDIQIVAEALDGLEAFQKVGEQSIDVALVDIRMPRADGFQFLSALRQAGLMVPVVLMHTIDGGTKTIRRCQELGAMGLVFKGQEKEVLLDAVRKVHAGEQLWNRLPD